MKNRDLLDQILPIIRSIVDDRERLEKVLHFLQEEIIEPDEQVHEIPEKYKKLVHDLADSLNAGLTCFLNPDTLEFEDVPQDLDDPDEYELTTGEKWEKSFQHDNWSNCIVIEPPGSHESYRFMEQFAGGVQNKKLRAGLFEALSRKGPFAKFKYVVESSNIADEWFEFRKQKLEEYVWDSIQLELRKNDI